MSTPQTLSQALPPHQHLDHRQRYLPSPQDRYLPPPRPSSNLSNGHYHGIPARPSSNLSNHQLPPPPRPQSGMSNSGYPHVHSQSLGGIDYTYATAPAHHAPNDDLRRTTSRASQHQRPAPAAAQPSRVTDTAAAQMSPSSSNPNNHLDGADDSSKPRRDKANVDWVAYFGGKPPAEIITIHDDDSPAPPAEIQRLPPPTTNGSSNAHHADKRRRVNGPGNDVPTYSTTHTPYSQSNGAGSAESLQATTAPTSLSSTAGSITRVDTTAQAGQKRKRTTRKSESDRKKQEVEKAGPRGYLAEYGDYMPPPKQHKKQREVVVPAINEVRLILIPE